MLEQETQSDAVISECHLVFAF